MKTEFSWALLLLMSIRRHFTTSSGVPADVSLESGGISQEDELQSWRSPSAELFWHTFNALLRMRSRTTGKIPSGPEKGRSVMRQVIVLTMVIFSLVVGAQVRAVAENSPSLTNRTASRAVYHTALLPDGRCISSTRPSPPAHWRDMEIQLLTYSITRDNPDLIQTVVGGHAVVLTKENVSLPAGPAVFIQVKRIPSAASRSKQATYENWIVLVDDNPLIPYLSAYAIRSIVTGDRLTARGELLDVAGTWHIHSRKN